MITFDLKKKEEKFVVTVALCFRLNLALFQKKGMYAEQFLFPMFECLTELTGH